MGSRAGEAAGQAHSSAERLGLYPCAWESLDSPKQGRAVVSGYILDDFLCKANVERYLVWSEEQRGRRKARLPWCGWRPGVPWASAHSVGARPLAPQKPGPAPRERRRFQLGKRFLCAVLKPVCQELV